MRGWRSRSIFDKDHWHETEVFQNAHVKEEHDWVTGELDRLLRRHGYVRNGLFYRAVAPNEDTIVLFCHFGVECVLLSHLLNISPMQLWHGTCAAPSSVTVLYTEERRSGVASFRMSSFGDVPICMRVDASRRLRRGSVRCIHGLTSGMTDGRST